MFIWIVITGGIFSFIASMGIGSNDAANAFATSVGAKALTLKQACIIAAFFETSGAILMGSHVADTIRKGIADYECFEENPEILMYGCMWVIFSVALWLFVASYFEMPVSTTHSCVGGMIGMTIATVGPNCVIWYKEVDTFPYVGGVSGIILSWFISPIFSAIISSIIFALTRQFVLRHEYSSKRLNYIYPILVGSTLTINSFFIIYKGAKSLKSDKMPIENIIGISFGIGICGGLIILPFIPKIRKLVEKKFNMQTTNMQTTNMQTTNMQTTNMQTTNIVSIELEEINNNQKDLNILSNNQLLNVIRVHNNAERFDPKIEEMFKYLQIFTASCDSFSHGANDVANAIGPFAAIFLIYRENGNIQKKVDMGDDSYWILGMGGIGIAFGLIIYGKKIINAIGTKLCKITPSRGTCIELGSALIIIIGSRLKIPLSTTHCQVGSTIGVGLLENRSFNINNIFNTHGINCYILKKTAFGWIITCIIVGLLAGLLSAQGIYGPSSSSIAICENNTLNFI